VLITDDRIAFDLGNVADGLTIEPPKPIFSDKLPVHRQNMNTAQRSSSGNQLVVDYRINPLNALSQIHHLT
jgi:hypothetical protein|tara:strand:- start:1706 stop:1918 length:213 start_codon:yes stop_codon:yes gene_type:complete